MGIRLFKSEQRGQNHCGWKVCNHQIWDTGNKNGVSKTIPICTGKWRFDHISCISGNNGSHTTPSFTRGSPNVVFTTNYSWPTKHYIVATLQHFYNSSVHVNVQGKLFDCGAFSVYVTGGDRGGGVRVRGWVTCKYEVQEKKSGRASRQTHFHVFFVCLFLAWLWLRVTHPAPAQQRLVYCHTSGRHLATQLSLPVKPPLSGRQITRLSQWFLIASRWY